MERYMLYVKRMLRALRLEKLLRRDVETLNMVEMLYRQQDTEKIFTEIWCRRILALAGALGAAVLFFGVCLCQRAPEDVIVDEVYVRAGPEGEEVTFGVEAETEAGAVRDELTLQFGGAEPESTGEPVQVTLDPREALLSGIREAVEAAAAEGGEGNEDGRIELPATVEGADITYTNPEWKRDFSAFYLSLSVICLLPFLWRHQRLERLRARETQLALDYPEMVNKVMLLLSAGLTVRGCFGRMCGEYRKRVAEGGERRYVYEEISYSLQEIKNGVSEAEAIEGFGKRCHQLPYLRFSSMMNQNIRKGSEGLVALLEAEAMEAFEKRKEQVKVMGETAGTKLLLPMILMLGVVMAIIVVPAFMTM